jgi:NADH-quinone oxidoreductase subunit F
LRYLKKTGYDSIIGQEAEKILQSFSEQVESLKSQPLEFKVTGAVNDGEYTVSENMSVGDLVEAAGGIPNGKTLKAVHVGYPIGGVFTPAVLAQPLSGALFHSKKLTPGSLEVHLINDDMCVAEYLRGLCVTLQVESCGRCVFCREGLRQMRIVTEMITKAKGQRSDIELMEDVASAMATAAQCLYGKAVGAMIKTYMEDFGEEVKAHILRKRCATMMCRQFGSYHILGSKCKGCEECADVCEAEAIEGKKGYIHVIDNYECTKCGECMEACEYGAIVFAGAVKPRTPDKPIRVGTWRGV